MIQKQTWLQFQETGLLWWVNRILHTFGWVIVIEPLEDNTIEVYPARTNYLGFSPEVDEKRFEQFQKHIKEK